MAQKISGNRVNQPRVIGVGASAGGLDPLIQLMTQLPPEFPAAIVVIQHLSPSQKSYSPEILSKQSRIPVVQIENGMKVSAGTVYIPPSNASVTLSNGSLLLSPRTPRRGLTRIIDTFFNSLAMEQKSKAIGVILSGNGNDGTQGLEKIRELGGYALVQDPATTKNPGMPESAIANHHIDEILTPKQIGKRLFDLLQNSRQKPTQSRKPAPHLPQLHKQRALDRIFEVLKNRFQADFSHYKPTTLKRRIDRRMSILKLTSLADYFHFLESNPQEAQALFDDLLIKVTDFFRDPKSYRALKKKILSKIVEEKTSANPIRVWVVGCATGEEAYSVAMSISEALDEAGKKNPFQIFATDLSDLAIQKARAGIYPKSIERTVSEERLKRFFTETPSGYRISKDIRKACLFSRHDVTLDPPFLKLDLVCCRNVLIYFDSALQKKVLPIFLYSLNPGGWLWLGRSESVGRLSSLFRVQDKVNRFYYREKDQRVPRLDFPTRTYWSEKPELSTLRPSTSTEEKSETQTEMENLILAEYAPPGVLINHRSEIILARGDTSPYLKLPRGAVSLNLFKMAVPELASELRIAVQSARKKSAPVRKKGIELFDGQKTRIFNLSVLPLHPNTKTNKQELLVLFERGEEPSPPSKKKKDQATVASSLSFLKSRKIEALEEELAEAKLYQQSLVEDFEATQEEISSSNEELQSANEELQSTIEELETAKEELQSTNEELITVNEELRNRNSDLLQLNNDLINLLGNVDMPIVMLGADGRVRRFTPKAHQFFNLIPTDVGRPISDVKPNFNCPDLSQLVTQVTETIVLQEHEVQDHNGHWYRLQVRPYKTTDHRIDGAVISLIDITGLKQSLIESQTALRYAESVTDTFPLPLVVLDESLKIIFTNQEFRKVFEIDPRSQLDADFLNLIHEDENTLHDLYLKLVEVLQSGKPVGRLELTHDFHKLGCKTMIFSAQQIRWQDPLPKAILLSIEDVTERKQLEQDLITSQERFRILIESAHDAIFIVDCDGRIEFANSQAHHWFGYSQKELDLQRVEILVPERFRQGHSQFREKYTKNPVPRPMSTRGELWGRRKDGSEFPVEVSLSPIRVNQEIKCAAIVRDVTETRKLSVERSTLFEQETQARKEAEAARAEAVRANEAKDVFLAILSHELRTPLTSILVWAQLLKRGPIDEKKLKHGLTTIEQSAQAQGQLINDLLDVSRIQSGKLALSITPIDPKQVATAAIESVRPVASAKRIQIDMNSQLQDERIRGDGGRLQQVFWNLLTNAIKFSPEGSTIEVQLNKTTRGKQPYAMFEVVDHGRGIDPRFLPYLFTRFSQQDSTITRLHGGLGIGLALVQDLTKAHGGWVTAESEGNNKGAKFTVYLPLVKDDCELQINPTLAQIGSSQSNQSLLAGFQIMIVDDEPSSLEAFVEIITAFGGHPVPCHSAKEAFNQFQKRVPDILISDIAMPIEDGYSLMRKIRALPESQGGKVPSLALTAFAAHHDIEKATKAGFNAHMTKPMNSDDLAQAILKLIKKP